MATADEESFTAGPAPRDPVHDIIAGHSLKFPHASATKTTVPRKPQVTVFAPGFS